MWSLHEWSFLGCVALGQLLSLFWPPFLPLLENRLAKGPCIVPGVRTPSKRPAGTSGLGERT